MATAGEIKCLANPDFAVICSFLDKYGEKLGLPAIGYANLQEWTEDSRRVHPTLIEIHVRLLRKAFNKCYNMQTDRWEKGLVRFCHRYSAVDAWEIERFGYKIAKVSTKLTLLKNLLEAQFDTNTKFKEKITDEKAEDMRCQPLGRDKNGLAYWYFLDNELNLRIFREDQDDVADETWELVCRTREDLARLIDNLEKGFETKLGKQEPSDLSEPTSDTNEDSRDSFYSTKQKGGIGPSPLTIKQEPVENGASDTPGSETDTNLTDSKIVLKIKQGKSEVDSPTKQLKDKFEKEKGLQLKKIKCKLKNEESADKVEEDDHKDEEDDEGADTDGENDDKEHPDTTDKESLSSNQQKGCVNDKEIGTEKEDETKSDSNNVQHQSSTNETLSLVSDVNEREIHNKKSQSVNKEIKSTNDRADTKGLTKNRNSDCDHSEEQAVDQIEKSHTHTDISKSNDKVVRLNQGTSNDTEKGNMKETSNEISQGISVDNSSKKETNAAATKNENDKDIVKDISDNHYSSSNRDSSNGDSCTGSKNKQKVETKLPQLDKPCDKTSSKSLENKNSNKCKTSENDEISSNRDSSIKQVDSKDNQKVETKDTNDIVKLAETESDPQSNTKTSEKEKADDDTTKYKLSVNEHQTTDTSIRGVKDKSDSDHEKNKFGESKDNHVSQKLDEKDEKSLEKNIKGLETSDIQDKGKDTQVSDTQHGDTQAKESQNSSKDIDITGESNQHDEQEENVGNGNDKVKCKSSEVESNVQETREDLDKYDVSESKQSCSVKTKINRKRKKDEISNTPNESSTDDDQEKTLSPEAKTRKIRTAVRKSTDSKERQSFTDTSKEENKTFKENGELNSDKSTDSKSKEEDEIVSGDKDLDTKTDDNFVKRNKNKTKQVEDKVSKSSKALSKVKDNKLQKEVDSDVDESGDIEMLEGSDAGSDSLDGKGKTGDDEGENDKQKSNRGSRNKRVEKKEPAETQNKSNNKKNRESSSEDDLSEGGAESNMKGVRSKAQKRQANESPEESPTEPASKRSKLRGRVLSRGRGKRPTQGSPSDNSSSTEDDDIPLSQIAGRGRKGRGKGRGKAIGARRKKSQPRKEGTAVKKKKVNDEEAFCSASESEQKSVSEKKSTGKSDGKTEAQLDNEDTDIEDAPQIEQKNNKKVKEDKDGTKASKDASVPSDDESGVRRSARVRSLRARKKKSPSPEYFPSENEELNNDDDYQFDCDEDLDDDDEEFSLRRKPKHKPVPVEEEVPKGRNALRYEAKTSKKVQEEESEEEPEDETPCCKCLKNEQPEWILLCDKCDAGYHTACLRPPLMVIPDGDWFCPPCEQNDLVLKLTENLKNLDQSLLKNDRLQRRKERLAYVSISLDNVLKDDTDSVGKKSPGKANTAILRSKKSRRNVDDDLSDENTEGDGTESSSGSDGSRSDNSRSRSSESDRSRSRSRRGDRKRRRRKRRQSSESDEESPPPRFVQRKCRSRNPVSYKFEEFEEMIADAIHDDISIPKEPKPKKVKPLGISRGKDMSNILGVSDEESKPKAKKKRKPRLTELDEEFDDDDTDDYKMSDASQSSSASKSYQSDASDLSGESVGRKESRQGTRRSSGRNRRRFGRYRDDFVVDSDFDSAEERQAIRRPRRKTAKYVDYNTETEEEESLATSDLDDSDFEQKRKKKLKRKEKKKQKKSKGGSGKRRRVKRVSSSEGSDSESEDTKHSKKKKDGKKRSEDEESSGSDTEEDTSKPPIKTTKKKVARRIEDTDESGSSDDENEGDKNVAPKGDNKQGAKSKKSKNVINSDSEEDQDESSDKKDKKKDKDETSTDESNDDGSSSSSDEDGESDGSGASNPSGEDEEGWEEIGAGSTDEMSSPRAKKSPSHAFKEKLADSKLMHATVVARKLPDMHKENSTIKVGDTKTDELTNKVGDTKAPDESTSKVGYAKKDESSNKDGDTKISDESTGKVSDTKTLDESASKVSDTKTEEATGKVGDTKSLDESTGKAVNKTGMKETPAGTVGKLNEVTPKKRGRKPKKALEGTSQDTQGEESPVKKKRGKKNGVDESTTNIFTETKQDTEKSEDKTESDKTVEKKDDSPLQSRNNQNAPIGVVKPEVRQGVIVENKHVIDARAADNRSNENMVSPLQGMREMAMRNQGNQGPEFGNFGPYQGGNNGPYPNRGMEGGYVGSQGFQNYPQGQGPYGQGMQGPIQGHPYGGMPQGHPQGMQQQQGPMNQGGPMNSNPQTNYLPQSQGQGPMSPNSYPQNNQYMPSNMQQPPVGFYQGPYQIRPEGQQNYGYGGQGPQQGPPNQNYPQGNFNQGQFHSPGYLQQQGPFPPPQMQGPPYMNQQGPRRQMGPQGQFQSQQGPPYQNLPYNYPHVPQPRHPPGYGPQPGHIQGGNPNQPFRPEPQTPGPQYHQLQTVTRQGMGSPGQVNSPNQHMGSPQTGMGSPQTGMGSPGKVVNSPGPVKPTSQISDQKPNTNSDEKPNTNIVEKEDTEPKASSTSQEKQETDKPCQDSAKEPSPKTQAVEPTQRKGFMMANILKPKSEPSEEQPSSKSSE